MCNLSDGVWKKVQERGEARGRILGAIDMGHAMGLNDDEMIAKITQNFSITHEEAKKYLAEAHGNA